MKKEARTFMPFDNRDPYGNPVLSPTTQKSVVPTNNVYTLQDIVFDGRKYRLPGMGGQWGVGDEAQPGSYKDKGEDYKLREKYLMEYRRSRDQKVLDHFMSKEPYRGEIWEVVMEGGVKRFYSFPLAQQYKEKLKDKGFSRVFLNRVAQAEQKKMSIIAESLGKCFMVESIDYKSGTKEVGSGFCVAPNYFVTCAHVIKTYDKNNIQNPTSTAPFADTNIRLIRQGKMYNAKLEAIDLTLDVALLTSNIDVEPFEVAKEVLLGQDVISIGSPHGYENNVSVGVVGSVGKKLYFYDNAPSYVFVDASVFPGNSGGPIIKLSDGQVCGIVTLIVTQEGTYGLNAALSPRYVYDFCRKNIEGF